MPPDVDFQEQLRFPALHLFVELQLLLRWVKVGLHEREKNREIDREPPFEIEVVEMVLT